MVGLRKLRQFQELGHEVILIIGDLTAQIGDPSGRMQARPQISPEEVEANIHTYLRSFFKVVEKEKTIVLRQSQWFSDLRLEHLLHLASCFTVAQFLHREDFEHRMKLENPVYLSELLYPLLQAYDSFAVRADVEVGGIDQKFNCLVGRELQKTLGQPPQQILLFPLLIGTDGKYKMSKSLKNYIGIDELPRDIYGKLMSIPDELILSYFELLTDEDLGRIGHELEAQNPMEAKKELAYNITCQLHGEEKAKEAQEYFLKVFTRREFPSEMMEYPLQGRIIDAVSLLHDAKLVGSRMEARRLLREGAIEVNGQKLTEPTFTFSPGAVIKVGKRGFLKIVEGK
jgi:tyrosyl-tRNA synthetase